MLAIFATIALWDYANEERWVLLALFAVAGAIGGFLRSSAYALAARSFSDREFIQWRTEALFAPVLGAASGLGAFMLIDAVLVENGSVNQAGQYLVSLWAGTAALSIVGQYVERGLARSAVSRTGMLGGPTSGALPLIGRFDELLDERLSEQTTVNYSGFVAVYVSEGPPWAISVRFYDGHSFDVAPSSLEADLLAADHVPIEIRGGVDRAIVPFTLSVTSDAHRSIPSVLAVSVPVNGISAESHLLVEPIEYFDSNRGYAAIEVGQAGATWQMVRVPLMRSFDD